MHKMTDIVFNRRLHTSRQIIAKGKLADSFESLQPFSKYQRHIPEKLSGWKDCNTNSDENVSMTYSQHGKTDHKRTFLLTSVYLDAMGTCHWKVSNIISCNVRKQCMSQIFHWTNDRFKFFKKVFLPETAKLCPALSWAIHSFSWLLK